MTAARTKEDTSVGARMNKMRPTSFVEVQTSHYEEQRQDVSKT